MSHFTIQTRSNHFASSRSDRAVIWNDMPLERRLHKVEQDLRTSPFGDLTPQLASGQVEITDKSKLPTAATDGFNVFYNREFCMAQSPQGLGFIMMHEAVHKAKKDLITYADLFAKDAELANISCDICNNTDLLARDPDGAHIAVPVGADGQPFKLCYDPERFPRGTSVYAIFRQLQADKQQGNNPADQYQPLDHHDHEAAAEQFAQGGDDTSSVERIIDRANSDGRRIQQAQQKFEESIDPNSRAMARVTAQTWAIRLLRCTCRGLQCSTLSSSTSHQARTAPPSVASTAAPLRWMLAAASSARALSLSRSALCLSLAMRPVRSQIKSTPYTWAAWLR